VHATAADLGMNYVYGFTIDGSSAFISAQNVGLVKCDYIAGVALVLLCVTQNRHMYIHKTYATDKRHISTDSCFQERLIMVNVRCDDM
jgi:hypothetical protein